MAKERIWIRLGGYVTADDVTMMLIKQTHDKDALVRAITENGFEVDGEAYIPEGDVFDLENIRLIYSYYKENPILKRK